MLPTYLFLNFTNNLAYQAMKVVGRFLIVAYSYTEMLILK